MRNAMTIGQLAKVAGVGVETIRYYQRRGLLETPSPPMGGRRHYDDAVVRQIAFIRRAQMLGFTLDEITELISISDGRDCAKGRAHASAKVEELAARVAELQRMTRQLNAMVKKCDARPRGERCPFIMFLGGGEALR